MIHACLFRRCSGQQTFQLPVFYRFQASQKKSVRQFLGSTKNGYSTSRKVCKKDINCAIAVTKKRTAMFGWVMSVQSAKLPPERNAGDIAKAARAAVVAISTKGEFTGSGVIVGNHAVLTNCADAKNMTTDFSVTDSKGRRHKIAKIRGLALVDMCVLTVPTLSGEARLTIAPFSGFEIGSTIRIYSA